MFFLSPLRTLSLAAACVPLLLSGQVLLEDGFESSDSTGYIIVDNTSVPGQSAPDGSVTFGYNYLADGIPLAPNSTIFGGRGLRMTANETAPGDSDHYTVFNTTTFGLQDYRVTVDMYMGVNGASGTTEFASIGVLGQFEVIHSTASPLSGSGHFMSVTGDGGSSSDYRHFTEDFGYVSSGETYLDPENSANQQGALYQSILPGGDFPGSPGNRWVTVSIDVSFTDSTITYAINGVEIIRTPIEVASLFDAITAGLLSLGYGDMFSSIGPHFVIFDNLKVVERNPQISQTINNGGLGFNLNFWDTGTNPSLVNLSTTFVRSGPHSLFIDSTGAGPYASPSASQSGFVSNPGDEWEFSGYLFTPTVIADASFGVLKLVFLDANGNELVPTINSKGFIESNPAFPGIETTPRVDGSSPSGQWIFVEGAGIAPPGTATVTLLLLNVNEGIAPGALYFDDIFLRRNIPELPPVNPPPPSKAIETIGADAFLALETHDTLEYTAEVSNDLEDWNPFVSFFGNGAITTLRVLGGTPALGEKAFYQVTYAPPLPVTGTDVLVNGDFSEGGDNLLGWEAYAIWEQPKGTYIFEDNWALADAPVTASGGVATFAMNTQLSAAEPFWINGFQNGMNFQQAFWSPDGIQAGNVVDLYGKVITFAGELEITEPYAKGAIVSVEIQTAPLVPEEAGFIYDTLPIASPPGGVSPVFRITRDGAGALDSVLIMDPGSGSAVGDEVEILSKNGDPSKTSTLVVTEVADSTVEVFIEFLDSSFNPIAPSVSLDLTAQGSGKLPFRLQATCPSGGLNVVTVGFRHRGLEGSLGQIEVSNVSLTASP
jgi:hypothetical protein